MGMYTQLHLGVTLRPIISDETINILRFMLGETDDTEWNKSVPQYELFKHDRWKWMLRSDSYYFNYKTSHLFKFDKIANHWWLNITCNLKDYEDEISYFLIWISQYIEDPSVYSETMLGYIRYEEEELPTIITWKLIETIKNELKGNK